MSLPLAEGLIEQAVRALVVAAGNEFGEALDGDVKTLARRLHLASRFDNLLAPPHHKEVTGTGSRSEKRYAILTTDQYLRIRI